MEATYQALVNSPVGANPMSIANLTSTELTIQTRLNDQSQYDIVSAHLRDLSGVISINLSAPPPASAHGQAFPVLSGQQPLISSHQAAQSSRGQMAQAMVLQNNPQDFSGPRLPSGASDSTQSMVFSHDGSAGASTGVPGPSRNRSAHAANSGRYPTSSQSGAPALGDRNARVPDPEHPGQTISRSALRMREKVTDPETGETVSRGALSNRQRRARAAPVENP
jgi:hypothetical protein